MDVLWPYLLKAYPDDYAKLSNWIIEHGGVDFPLHKLVYKPYLNSIEALEELFINVHKGKTERDIKMEFACNIHYADYYEECLVSLDSILSRNPKDTEALALKAHTFIDLGKDSEAWITAQECLSIDGPNVEALGVVCDIHETTGNWTALLQTCLYGVEAAAEYEDKWRFMFRKIFTLLRMGDIKSAEAHIDALPEGRIQTKRKLAYVALVAFLNGDHIKAFDIAKSVLSDGWAPSDVRAILKSLHNITAEKVGQNVRRLVLTKLESRYLSSPHIATLLTPELTISSQ